jgi:hypothetical protein
LRIFVPLAAARERKIIPVDQGATSSAERHAPDQSEAGDT